jgi:hypothetical protein
MWTPYCTSCHPYEDTEAVHSGIYKSPLGFPASQLRTFRIFSAELMYWKCGLEQEGINMFPES